MKPSRIGYYIESINTLGAGLTEHWEGIGQLGGPTCIVRKGDEVLMQGDFSAVRIFLRGYLSALRHMEVCDD